VRIFREGSGCWGYRTVWARLRREGVRASEKRVARVMREEGLEVVYVSANLKLTTFANASRRMR